MLGNHEVTNTYSDVYADASAIMPAEYYSFDKYGVHFIVLNASGIPFFSVDNAQLTWLENDLASSPLPKIIFTHQRLDEDYPGDDPRNPGNPYCMSGSVPGVDCYSAFAYNSDEVRSIIEADGNVLAVFSGHTYSNSRVEINGTVYINIICAGCSGNTHAIVHVSDDGNIIVEGFGGQLSYTDVDRDGDLIPDDGDESGIAGDNYCTGGEWQDCDDNCADVYNPGQEDVDGDSLGDLCDDCLVHATRISDTLQPYSTLSEAYDAVESFQTIQSQATNYIGDMSFDEPVSIVIDGGYNCDYTEITGNTIITGNITISEGQVTLHNIILQ